MIRPGYMLPHTSFYKTLLDNLYDGVYFVDLDRQITYWNKGAERLTGYMAHEITRRFCWDNILRHVNHDGVSLCHGLCPLSKAMKEDLMLEQEIFFHHREGYRVPVLVRVSPIKNEKGEIVGAVEIFSDNSPQITLVQRIRELERLSLLDGLTETGNRRYGEIILHAKFDEMKRYNWKFGVLFIDIDRFKEINDSYGHDAGDRVLKTVSKTLQNSIRSLDAVVRWGGEEFVIILSSADEDRQSNLAERLRMLIEQSSIPLAGGTVRVTVSIGATLVHSDDTPQTVVQRADSLMYESKTKGRNMVSFG